MKIIMILKVKNKRVKFTDGSVVDLQSLSN